MSRFAHKFCSELKSLTERKRCRKPNGLRELEATYSTSVEVRAGSAASRSLSERQLWRLWLVGAVAYASVGAIAGQRLTFFWDDWDALLSQDSQGPSVIFMGSGGHWGPISRSIVWLETWLFGTQYWMFVTVNFVLLYLGASFWLLAVRRATGLALAPAVIAGGVFLLAPGVMANSMILTNLGWILAFALFGSTAFLAVRNAPMHVVVISTALASFAMSGLAVPLSLLASTFAYLAIKSSRHAESKGMRYRKPLIILAIAAIATSFGSWIARLNPTAYYADLNAEGGVSVEAPTAIATQLVELLDTWKALVISWSISPYLPGLVLLDDGVERLTLLVDKYSIASWTALMAVVLGGVAVAILRPTSRRTLALASLPLLTVAVWALMIATVRSGGIFAVRYSLIWLLPALVSLTLLAHTSRDYGNWLKWGLRLPILGLTVTLLLAVITLPRGLQSAANVDRPRWERSQELHSEGLRCLSDGRGQTDLVVAPATTDEQLCSLFIYLDEQHFRVW